MDLIFVHGALVRDGAWWWQRTADLLAESGIRSHSLELPSCGEGGGLGDDAAALRAMLDGVGSAIVVGHSYGGTVIAEAGQHPAVSGLVLISSYLPEVGQTQSDITASDDPPSIAMHGDVVQLDGYDAQSFGARFVQDAPDAVAGALERLAPQSVAAFMTPTTQAGWQGVDSTYLVCTQDRSTSLELQRFHAAKATRSVDLPTGHHPFISRPDLVASAVSRIASSL
jgi:pimeloyl-ACP methyl ester carboxylesterase